MWRESVYNGTLRPCPILTAKSISALDRLPENLDSDPIISGPYLDDLLNKLAFRCGDISSISRMYSINRIDAGLYLGDKYAAKDKRFLLQQGITHVLNCSEGTHEFQVDTGAAYYRGTNIKYMGIPGHDRPTWNISVYFDEAARFIHQAISSGGRVFVHCVVGISRSATMIIAYLMIYKHMNAASALRYVFERRRVYPNAGFLTHLAHLNNVLFKRRAFTVSYERGTLPRATGSRCPLY